MGFFRRMIGREPSTPTAQDYAIAGATTPEDTAAAAARRRVSTFVEPIAERLPELAPLEPPPNPLFGELRMRHFYSIGKSGTGKTTLLKILLQRNFLDGDGCAFFDPHGDAALDLLGLIPDDRVADVIYFDPTDEHSYAFNLLALPYPPHKLAEDVVSAFKMLFSISDAPRLEHILRNSLLTLLSDRDRTPHCLKDLQRLLRNPDYRSEIVEHIQNEELRDFWEHEFASMPKDATSSILNKFSALLAPMSDLERVLSSTDNALDFPKMMNDGKIFIANLAKGKLGDEPSRLLGALLATAIQQAALARADRPREERRPFFFYVDEFQNYAVASFSTILSEARKYNLALTLANQTLKQIPDDIRDAIFGNVALLAAFQVSSDDATRLVREMHRSRMMCRYKTDERTFNVRFLPDTKERSDARKRLYDFTVNEVGEPMEWRGKETFAGERGYGLDHYGNPPDHLFLQFRQEYDGELRRLRTMLGNPYVIAKSGVGTLFDIAVDPADPSTLLLHGDQRQTLTPDFLRDVFSATKWWEESAPSVDDFLNLKPLHAYLRIERAENVSPIHLDFPDPPNKERREEIIQRTHALNKRTPPPEAPKRKPPTAPTSEKDFWQ